MSGEELVHLSLYFALTFRVDGQEVAGEGQRVAAGFVARQKKDEGLTHDLVLGYHLLRGTPGGGLLRGGEAVVLLPRGRRLRLLICGMSGGVKVLQRHTLLAGPSIQHQLEEVSTPLHAHNKALFNIKETRSCAVFQIQF